jgi:hypothetical protein
MGLVVRPGPLIAELARVVNGFVANYIAVKARCKGVACAMIHGKWCDGVNKDLLKAT